MHQHSIMTVMQQIIKKFDPSQKDQILKQMVDTKSAGLWWKENRASTSNSFLLTDPAQALLVLAFDAPNFASAFNAAYQIALRVLFKDINNTDLACLCVSEKGGNSPKIIECSMNNKVLNGYKTFVTSAQQLDTLLLMVNDISTQVIPGQKDLKLVKIQNIQSLIRQNREDFKIILPNTSSTSSSNRNSSSNNSSNNNQFLPEIEKGHLKLTNFDITNYQGEVLAGDAHQDYSKPFSIMEGICIRLACVSQLLKWSLVFSWPETLKSDLIFQITGLSNIVEDPLSPISQLIIDSQNRLLNKNLQEIEALIPNTDSFFQEYWRRDKIFFYMDLPLRENRLKKAYEVLF